MRMTRVRIRRYRCLDDVEIAIHDITTLIGPNGVGKSSVLRSLDWFFNGWKTGCVGDGDVHAGAAPDERRIEVEVEFGGVSPADRELLGDLAVQGQGDTEYVVIGRAWQAGEDSCWVSARSCSYFDTLRAAGTAAERIRRYREFRSEHPEFELPAAQSADAAEQNLKTWEAGHPDSLVIGRLPRPDLFTGAKRLRDIYDYVFVSADLRADEETKDAKASLVGRILEHAIDRSAVRDRFEAWSAKSADELAAVQDRLLKDPLAELSGKLTAAVAEFSRGRMITLSPVLPVVTVPAVSVQVQVCDGNAVTSVDKQGHGFQRVLMIAALRSLAENEPVPGTRVMCLAIEEPELFQHPVQARAFATVLRRLAADQGRGVQVAYATHSPYFLEAEGFTEVRRLTREPAGGTGATMVRVHSATRQGVEARLSGVSSPEQVARQLSGVFLRRLPEALFAGAALLVEGVTDQAVLEGCALRHDPLNVNGIVVVDAGGKDAIPLAHAILESLGVPCYVLFDGDAGSPASPRSPDALHAAAAANRRLLRYLGAPEEDHPDAVTDRWAAFADTLETALGQWAAWQDMRKQLIQDGQGIPGKDAATYRLAAIRAAADPPELLADIIGRARLLSPEGRQSPGHAPGRPLP